MRGRISARGRLSGKESLGLQSLLPCSAKAVKTFSSARKTDRLIWMENGKPVRCTAGRLTAVEAEAFEGIAAAAVEIPEGVRSIGERAFASCLKLRKICIPSGCTLGADVFKDCTLVYVFGTSGSDVQAYCSDAQYGNCVFVPEK